LKDQTRGLFSVCLLTDGSDKGVLQCLSLDGRSYNRDEFDAEKALRQINLTIYPTARLVQEINRVCSPHVEQGDDIPSWEESFVVAEDPSQLDNVNFPVDMSKGAALVVTGESGSGKSWFAKYFVPNKLGKQDPAHIYYTLSDKDVANLLPENSDPMFRHACKVGMHHLDYMGMSDTPVYE
jgi:ABC-type ATPase with predicted acetyltransferase domain